MCLNLAQRYFHCRNIEHNDRSENDTFVETMKIYTTLLRVNEIIQPQS
jgi:hypothetical protein